jgi:hypothetical protein
MADPPRYPETGDDPAAEPRGRPDAGTPRWREVLLWVIGIALAAAFIVLHLTGTLGPGAH